MSRTMKNLNKSFTIMKAITTRSPVLWNILPSDLKACNSFSLFKSKLNNLYLTKLATYCPPDYT